MQLIVPSFTAVGDEDEQNRWWEMARTQVAFYGSTPNYAFIFDDIGFEGTTARIREKQKARDIEGMAGEVSDDVLEHFVIRCGWDDLADRLVERYEGIANRVVLYFAYQAWRRDAISLGRFGEVASDVHERTKTG